MSTRWRLVLLAVLLSLTAGCDQAAKSIARQDLKSAPARFYLGGLLRVQYTENPGAFLSLGADLPDTFRSWLFTVGVAVLVLGLLVYAVVGRRLSPVTVVALALFIGGGLGNLIDRLAYRDRVADMLQLGIGPVRTGIFNLADVYIVAGVALLAIAGLRGDPQPSERPPH
jgi:signal peptidase II